jgi:cytochrome P450
LDKEITIQGYHIPPKTPIFLNLYSPSKCPMHHPNPEKFIPERYRDKTVKYDVYTTMTFGGGAVMCPGRRMAELQLQLGVISLVKNFKMKLIGDIPKAKVTTILSPDFRTSNPTIVFEKRKK